MPDLNISVILTPTILATMHHPKSVFSHNPRDPGVQAFGLMVQRFVLPPTQPCHGVGLHIQLAWELTAIVELDCSISLKVIVKPLELNDNDWGNFLTQSRVHQVVVVLDIRRDDSARFLPGPTCTGSRNSHSPTTSTLVVNIVASWDKSPEHPLQKETSRLNAAAVIFGVCYTTVAVEVWEMAPLLE